MRAVPRASGGPATSARRPLLWFLGILLVSAALLPMPVRAPPPAPMTVYGHAYDRGGSPLPPGTPVRAFLDGVQYSNDSVVLDALGSYSLFITGNWVLNGTTPETPAVKEGPNAGEAVVFAAGNFTGSADTFQEVLSWSPAGTVSLDLHLGSLATSPEPLKFQGIVTEPARGGNQIVIVCNPTGSPVALSSYYLQVDRPGTYDGGNASLSGTVASGLDAQEPLPSATFLMLSGDAVKLVYRNPGGAGASAGGGDVVVDRVEFNATAGGSLFWQPGNTIAGDAPAPSVAQVLERSPNCTDTNSPSDFALAAEPGLPADAGPSVVITAPAAGQAIAGAQPFTISWALAHAFFQASYLKVWVNVTAGGISRNLVNGTAGTMSATWDVPDTQDDAASVRVTVVDPFGLTNSTTTAFRIVRAQPFSVLLAVLLVVVVIAFVLVGILLSRRKAKRPPEQPVAPPTSETAAAQVPLQAAPEARPTGASMKACPRCGTKVRAEDDSCFFCGYLFVQPPPP